MLATASTSRVLARARWIHTSSALRDEARSALEIKLRDGLKAAMKSKDKPVTTCMKTILADVVNATKSSPDPSKPLSDDGVIATLRKGIQNRTQAALSYAPDSSSSHSENYENLQKEISILQSYLPKAPSLDEISRTLSEIVQSLDKEARENKSVVGIVMKQLMEKLGEGAKGVDKKEVGKLVFDALRGNK
ncbi:Yqey-like protein-domain-containing protein [Naematelia encephala]|uniref:Altered inheritance of mitochondria protein 41 n=1 Tax=Naematelia encephala TaxID=71784 RepID=A0A1Y2B496_9TREE|nr:Yqey-like protein-domain-containing protein [Naematelia encephala]